MPSPSHVEPFRARSHRPASPYSAVAALAATALATLLAVHRVPSLPVRPKLQLFALLGAQGLLLLTIPLLVARGALGLAPAAIGLSPGAPRAWLREVGLLLLLAWPLLFALSRLPSIRAYYPVYAFARREPWLLVPSTLAFAAYGFTWEFLFRGFLQLGSRPALGRASIMLQLIPFVAAHVGKPPAEVAVTVVSGLFLGGLAHRHSTIWPAWALHIGCSTALNALCLLP